jgi:hypothetical protein
MSQKKAKKRAERKKRQQDYLAGKRPKPALSPRLIFEAPPRPVPTSHIIVEMPDRMGATQRLMSTISSPGTDIRSFSQQSLAADDGTIKAVYRITLELPVRLKLEDLCRDIRAVDPSWRVRVEL